MPTDAAPSSCTSQQIAAPTDAAPKLKLTQKQGELNNKINVKIKPQEGY